MSEHFENLEVNLRIGHTSQALLGIEFENVGKSKTTDCLCYVYCYCIRLYVCSYAAAAGSNIPPICRKPLNSSIQ